MGSPWRAEGEPRRVTAPKGSRWHKETPGAGVDLQYLRSGAGVGAHEVLVSSGERLIMLPDSTTTARKRTGAVSVALGDDHSVLAAIIGELVLAGATNLWLDGKPLFPRDRTGRWIVELARDGEVEMRYLAEADEG